MRVEVPGVGLADSPIWWQKFYNYYEDNYYEDVECPMGVNAYLRQVLNDEWGARMLYVSGEFSALHFKDEAMATWFIMRWS